MRYITYRFPYFLFHRTQLIIELLKVYSFGLIHCILEREIQRCVWLINVRSVFSFTTVHRVSNIHTLERSHLISSRSLYFKEEKLQDISNASYYNCNAVPKKLHILVCSFILLALDPFYCFIVFSPWLSFALP